MGKRMTMWHLLAGLSITRVENFVELRLIDLLILLFIPFYWWCNNVQLLQKQLQKHFIVDWFPFTFASHQVGERLLLIGMVLNCPFTALHCVPKQEVELNVSDLIGRFPARCFSILPALSFNDTNVKKESVTSGKLPKCQNDRTHLVLV